MSARSPGPLAGFAESDAYNIESFLATEAGANFEVIVKDSQSDPNRAAAVAKELIVDDEINLMIVASTPETTNPVATTCEAEGMPVISTMAPWQPWFIGQQGNPGDPASWQPFNYAFHYFWGLEDVIAVFLNMWDQIETNKVGGRPVPQRRRRQCLGRSERGRRPRLCGARAIPLNDPGRYQNLNDDFSRPDQRLQGRQRRDRHRRGDPARLHHLPQPGAAAGLQPQDHHRGQGHPVPAIGRGVGRGRPQPVVRSVVERARTRSSPR